jgi:hypothetical protein
LKELECGFDPTAAEHLRCFFAPVANEAGRLIEVDVFRIAREAAMQNVANSASSAFEP